MYRLRQQMRRDGIEQDAASFGYCEQANAVDHGYEHGRALAPEPMYLSSRSNSSNVAFHQSYRTVSAADLQYNKCRGSNGKSSSEIKSVLSGIQEVDNTHEIRAILTGTGFKPRLPGLTKLISQLSKNGYWQKALCVYQVTPSLGVNPDTALANSAISAADKGGQWQIALRLFDDMDRQSIDRDAITYSSLISALSKGRQWVLAIKAFQHMLFNGIEVDAVTCCSLITALDKGAQWELAEKVFHSMYNHHPQFASLAQIQWVQETAPPRHQPDDGSSPHGSSSPDNTNVPILRGEVLTAGEDPPQVSQPGDKHPEQDMRQIFQDYAERSARCTYPTGPIPGVPSSVRTLTDSILVSNLAVDESIFSQLEQSVAKLAFPDLLSAQPLIAQLEMAQKHGRGRQQGSYVAKQSISHKKIAPNRVCCNALLAAYCHAQPTQWKKAVRLLEQMWECGGEVIPDIVSYNTVLKACGEAEQKQHALLVFRTMVMRGIPPTVATYNNLMGTFQAVEEASIVIRLWNCLEKQQIAATATNVNYYLQALIFLERCYEASALVQCMFQSDYPCKPNTQIVSTAMELMLSTRQYQEVLELYEDSQSRNIAPNKVILESLITAHAHLDNWALCSEYLLCALRTYECNVPKDLVNLAARVLILQLQTNPANSLHVIQRLGQIVEELNKVGGEHEDLKRHLHNILNSTVHHPPNPAS